MRDDELRTLHKALFGVNLRPEGNPALFLESLRASQSSLPLTMRWMYGEELVTLMMTGLDETGQVCFFRPGAGEEKASQEELVTWFREREALGYVPE